MEQEAFEKRQQHSTIEGWMVLEIFGHQRYAGYVSVENVGVASMIRLDVPALDERERVTKRSGYDREGNYIPPGATVKDGAVAGYTKLFGVGAIYAMTPCTQEACLAAVEEIQPRPMTPISLSPPQAAMIAALLDDQDDEDDIS